jgi:hypothetical protein
MLDAVRFFRVPSTFFYNSFIACFYNDSILQFVERQIAHIMMTEGARHSETKGPKE